MKARGKHSGWIEVAPAMKVLAGLANSYRAAWEAACKHDGIPPDSKFVVFSDGNPFARFIGPALMEYREAEEQYQAGGYIGLTIE